MIGINTVEETAKIVKFIKEQFLKKGFEKAVIGISGGLDSAVVATLLVKALGKENVYGYRLPYGEQKDIVDADSVIRFLDIDDVLIDIQPSVKTFFISMGDDQSVYRIRLGNIKARVRMIILYDRAMLWNALVVGTGNKTELDLGYFTHYGDGACAMEPIGHLYKTELWPLARYLGVPVQIVNKVPSAGLWEGQTDEKELGMKYEEIDKILDSVDHIFLEGKNLDSCKNIFKPETLGIVSLIIKNKFKKELPPQPCRLL